MKSPFKRINYAEMVANATREDYKIGNDIILLDEYELDAVEYEFTAVGNTFIEVMQGKGTLTVDGRTFEVDGHCLIGYLHGQVLHTRITSSRTVQRGGVFSDRFLEDLYLSALKFNDIRSSIIENPVIVLDELAAKGIEMYVNTLKIIASSSRNFEKLTCIKYLTLSLFYGPLFNVFKKKIDSASFRSPKLSTGFFHLLERHFREEHELSYYADKLNISVRYLYTNVRSTTGKSPGYWIDYYMMSEAKKLLADMEFSIVQVSDTLNFAGLSQFGKFFKKHEGISPSAYRKSLT